LLAPASFNLPNYQITQLPNSFAFAQFPAQLPKLLLLVSLQPAHNFSDSASVLGKNFGDQLFSRRRNASQYKAFVFALLLSLDQPTFLQVVDHQGKISAAGEDTPGQVAQVLRPDVVQGLQDGKLAEREPFFFQPDARIGKRSTGSALQLYISAERAFLRGRSFEFLGHGFFVNRRENLPQRTLRTQRELTAEDAKSAEETGKFAKIKRLFSAFSAHSAVKIAKARKPNFYSLASFAPFAVNRFLLDIKLFRVQQRI
jgi:hypothetical protein